MADLGFTVNGLSGKQLKEFRNGVIICKIIEKICKVTIEGKNEFPKTNADALQNIQKAFEILYAKCSLPLKYKYYDDQIIMGNGIIIRSLLKDMKNHQISIN